MKHHAGGEALNVGTGTDITIGEFAQIVADVVGYRGRIAFDTSRPDGAPQKLLNVSKLASLGWTAKIPLRAGLADAYADFLKNEISADRRLIPDLLRSSLTAAE
jgi:GDP-L-fucose synthase